MTNKAAGDQNGRSVHRDLLSPLRSLRQAVAETGHLGGGVVVVKFCSSVRVPFKQAAALVESHRCFRKAGVLFCTPCVLSLKTLLKK